MDDPTDPTPRGWSKLSASITHSSIWPQPDDVFRVWIWFIAEKGPYGRVRASVPAIARACAYTVERTREIIAYLESPDPESGNAEHEGRRLLPIPGGWQVVSHTLYRGGKPATVAERVQEHRARKRDVTAGNGAQQNSLRSDQRQIRSEADQKKSNKGENKLSRWEPPEAYAAADALRGVVLAQWPTLALAARPWPGPTREKWARTMRLLVDADGRRYPDVLATVEWLGRQFGGRYSFVVQSADALREKWDRIQTARVQPTAQPRERDLSARDILDMVADARARGEP